MPDIFTSPKNTSEDKTPSHNKNSKVNLDVEVGKHHEPNNSDSLLKIPPDGNVHNLPGHTHNPLTGYCLFPDHVGFSSADPEEKIILLLRRHPITNVTWIIASFIMIIVPSVFPLLPYFDQLPAGFQITITLTWYLITTAYVLENFLEWFFNINLITSERVIDVDFINLLYREVTEAELEKIQEPTFDIGGALQSFFNYGDVQIQTAAEISRIEFHNVPNPDKVVKLLRDLSVTQEIERMKKRYK